MIMVVPESTSTSVATAIIKRKKKSKHLKNQDQVILRHPVHRFLHHRAAVHLLALVVGVPAGVERGLAGNFSDDENFCSILPLN